jgi:hypothetical protein
MHSLCLYLFGSFARAYRPESDEIIDRGLAGLPHLACLTSLNRRTRFLLPCSSYGTFERETLLGTLSVLFAGEAGRLASGTGRQETMDDPSDFPAEHAALRDLDSAMRCPICKELYSE